jgi:hypothetical protein
VKNTGRTLAGRPLVARYPAVVPGGTVAQNPCPTVSMPGRPAMPELSPAPGVLLLTPHRH